MLSSPESCESTFRLRLPVIDDQVVCPRLGRKAALERCLECGYLLLLDRTAQLVIVCAVAVENDPV